MKTALTQDRLKQLLTYDSETGHFRRRISGGGMFSGSIAGNLRPNGYILIGVDYEAHLAHRLVWLYVYGYLPKQDIDHINGIKTDNRIMNLREASRSQNLGNSRKRIDNTSGFKGVTFDKRCGKWVAQISIMGKQTRIGGFRTKEAAYAAYCRAAKNVFKEFAKTP